jgi:hypothetical protein
MAARTPDATYEQWAKRLGELVKEGYAPPGTRVAAGEINATTALAAELRMAPNSFQPHIRQMRKRGFAVFWGGVATSAQIADKQPELSRAETHDAGFWKKKFTVLQRQLGEAEHMVEQLSGLRGVPFEVPRWLIDSRRDRRGKSVIGCLVSDIHMGEVITAEEIQGINAFSVDICRARLRRYFTAACTIGQR